MDGYLQSRILIATESLGCGVMASMGAVRIEEAAECIAERGVQPITYRFGPFMLDTSRRVLFSGLEARPLPEKLFQILALLLEAQGQMVDKETFFARVWPEGQVSDANLTQHVFVLRQLLGENARQNQYIVTVAGKGYRFVKPIESKLGLSMKGSCERCRAALSEESAALICSYECTFCSSCAECLHSACPNCGGELLKRPRRLSSGVRAQ
jgi:DNA-binding winged helix-turn-helix (wHTH) protein